MLASRADRIRARRQACDSWYMQDLELVVDYGTSA